MKPIIPWIGGKRRLAKHLLPQFPEHNCYVEPFAGAAALFFMKPPAKVEVINDINNDLICLYRVVQHHLEEFCRQFKHALISRQMFTWLNDTPPETLTDIQRAARFFYLQKMCFGGKVESRSFGIAPSSPPRLNLLRLEEDLSQAHLRLSRVYIEHLSWQNCITKYDRPNTFHYLDPPYWTERAQIGDMFGVVNSLFSGLAFVGLLVAIILQKQELGLQRVELAETRKELKRSAEAQERSEEALRMQAASLKATAQINALDTLIRVNDHAREMERNIMYGMASKEPRAKQRDYVERLEQILDSKPEDLQG